MVAFDSIGTATSSIVEFFFSFALLKVLFFVLYAAVIDLSKAMLRVRFLFDVYPTSRHYNCACGCAVEKPFLATPTVYFVHNVHSSHETHELDVFRES